MDHPIISFIVPLYNQEKYIIPSLKSIVDSGLSTKSYEVIVWNDGSTDKSEELVRKYAETNPNICLISQFNHGVSHSRNQALLKAIGEYIWFVDSDDLVNSKSVTEILNEALAGNLDMIGFNWKSLLPDGKYEQGIHPLHNSSIQSGRNIYMGSIITMAPWAFMYKREFLLKNRLFFPEDYKTCEDIQFNQKALFLATKVRLTSQIGYIYRHMHESATKGHGNRVVEDQIRRLKDELVWFSDKKDPLFLQTIIYRNLREINVWLAWSDKEDKWFKDIKQILKEYRVKPSIDYSSWFILIMTYFPRELYYIQHLFNKVRRYFFR